jgi:hypothetical protein
MRNDVSMTGSIGFFAWIHDIEAWANAVARLLRKDGVLSLLGDHPASCLFSQEINKWKRLN